MDYVKTRRTKRTTVASAMRRHIGIACYLFGAEVRFKGYCVWLYYHKRPQLAYTYAGTLVSTIMMGTMAMAAQFFM